MRTVKTKWKIQVSKYSMYLLNSQVSKSVLGSLLGSLLTNCALGSLLTNCMAHCIAPVVLEEALTSQSCNAEHVALGNWWGFQHGVVVEHQAPPRGLDRSDGHMTLT